MQLVAPDILVDARGMGAAIYISGLVLGLALWLFGWWGHRFWIVLCATVVAGVYGLSSARATGMQPFVAGLLLALAALWGQPGRGVELPSPEDQFLFSADEVTHALERAGALVLKNAHTTVTLRGQRMSRSPSSRSRTSGRSWVNTKNSSASIRATRSAPRLRTRWRRAPVAARPASIHPPNAMTSVVKLPAGSRSNVTLSMIRSGTPRTGRSRPGPCLR